MMISPGTPRIQSSSGTKRASFPRALWGSGDHSHGRARRRKVNSGFRKRGGSITASGVTIDPARRSLRLSA
jgi:hypothetical protein